MYKNIFIVVLFFIIFLMTKSAISLKDTQPVVIEKIDTLRQDTTIYKWKKGKDIVHDTTIYDTMISFVNVDTNAILKDFFAKNVFKDTLSLPEGIVAINDTISENKIYGRGYDAKLTQKTIVKVREIRTIIQPKPSLYWGFMVTRKEDVIGYGGGIIYKSPKKGILQFNITNNNQMQLGYYSKIF
jgi:predicted GNAT family acetyltransferase